jgi:carboxypeptidase PM20D1
MLLLLVAVLAFNTLRLKAEPLAKAPTSAPVDPAAVGRLSQAVRNPTVSVEVPPSAESLAAFHAFLRQSFPRAHASLKAETIGGGSLLYTWRGSDPNLPALLLAAHQDTVPVESAGWQHPPFGGDVDGGFVWGRGTLDDKGSLMAILEAVERLLAQGFQPRQTIFLAFGHNEEIGGEGGAQAIAALLRQRRANIGIAVDEGSAVLDRIIAGVEPPIAMIGVAEKGYVSVEVVAAGSGGHSSMPTEDNAALRVARAADRITASPMPARIDGAVAGLLDSIAPYTRGTMRVALANRWLTEPLVRRQLLASPTTAAALRTTTALTVLDAGTKDNVLPQRARAVINHRILPGETIETVLAHDRAAVDDPNVTLRALPGGFNPGAPVPTGSPEYKRIAAVVRAIFPNAVVAPGMVVASTDLRHYQRIARASFRFGPPVTISPADVERIHGANERIGIADYMRAISFYERLITSSP